MNSLFSTFQSRKVTLNIVFLKVGIATHIHTAKSKVSFFCRVLNWIKLADSWKWEGEGMEIKCLRDRGLGGFLFTWRPNSYCVPSRAGIFLHNAYEEYLSACRTVESSVSAQCYPLKGILEFTQGITSNACQRTRAGPVPCSRDDGAVTMTALWT